MAATCAKCGATAPAPRPQCPACFSWGTLTTFRRLRDVAPSEAPRLRSGIEPLDHLVGGGWVAGCAYELLARKGTGKSTLALDLVSRWRGSAYLTSEETLGALRLRADRIGCELDAIEHAGEIAAIERLDELPLECVVAVIDSINQLASPGLGQPGSNAQLVHAAQHAIRWARSRRGVVLLIGQLNAEGHAAGAEAVGHAVDCLIWAEREEGLADAPFKLWTEKNRHGALTEIYARHTARGLVYERSDQADGQATESPSNDRQRLSGDELGARARLDDAPAARRDAHAAVRAALDASRPEQSDSYESRPAAVAPAARPSRSARSVLPVTSHDG